MTGTGSPDWQQQSCRARIAPQARGMLPGHNHNYRHRGLVFHVQTEDGGARDPRIVTQVFLGGRLLTIERQSYRQLIAEGTRGARLEAEVRERMKAQHLALMHRIRGGELDGPAGLRPLRSEAPTVEIAIDFLEPGEAPTVEAPAPGAPPETRAARRATRQPRASFESPTLVDPAPRRRPRPAPSADPRPAPSQDDLLDAIRAELLRQDQRADGRIPPRSPPRDGHPTPSTRAPPPRSPSGGGGAAPAPPRANTRPGGPGEPSAEPSRGPRSGQDWARALFGEDLGVEERSRSEGAPPGRRPASGERDRSSVSRDADLTDAESDG